MLKDVNIMPNDILVLILMIICLYTDIKERKIYNKVIVPAILCALVYNTVTYGLQGTLFSLKGLGAGVALLFMPFIMGGFGAGDVKLMGAIGAFNGPLFIFKVFIFTGLAGGLIAVMLLIYRKKMLVSMKRIWHSMYIMAVSRFKVITLDSLDKTDYDEAFPYGIAIAIGTLAAYLVR